MEIKDFNGYAWRSMDIHGMTKTSKQTDRRIIIGQEWQDGTQETHVKPIGRMVQSGNRANRAIGRALALQSGDQVYRAIGQISLSGQSGDQVYRAIGQISLSGQQGIWTNLAPTGKY